MKVAITCAENEVFQHFGHTPGFAVFEITEGKVVSRKDLSSGDSGHGALALLLQEEGIQLLICGGIGGGAINALASAGIQVVGGAEGDVDEVAKAFAEGNLKVRSNFHCNHHHDGEGHTCGNHSCGSNHTCH